MGRQKAKIARNSVLPVGWEGRFSLLPFTFCLQGIMISPLVPGISPRIPEENSQGEMVFPEVPDNLPLLPGYSPKGTEIFPRVPKKSNRGMDFFPFGEMMSSEGGNVVSCWNYER